jgi:hypothetical protein
VAEERILNILGVDYIVSSDGRIYSTKNVGRGKYHKEIKQRKNADGYMDITVGPNSFRTTRKVHRLVAEAFIPNPDNLPEVDHIDDIRDNNDVSNLQWISRIDNIAKIPYERNSKSKSCEGNSHARLTKDDIKVIRYKYKNDNVRISDLAKEYGVGYSTIWNIVYYKTWINLD